MEDRIQEAFDKFVEQVQQMVLMEHRRRFPMLEDPQISFTTGRRYWKILRDNSAYCFVDRTNGDILKAATWKTPAKHARGNVLNEDPLNAVTEYGAVHLR